MPPRRRWRRSSPSSAAETAKWGALPPARVPGSPRDISGNWKRRGRHRIDGPPPISLAGPCSDPRRDAGRQALQDATAPRARLPAFTVRLRPPAPRPRVAPHVPRQGARSRRPSARSTSCGSACRPCRPCPPPRRRR
ncbi:hypothetical protein SDC9_20633 [bioreactor metagenome]|uniref:Uncharacterized protein n=1 Tax=bioreactor metagenome TaxID=1076179 RepID=A0A644U794_9ZZZZ